MIRPTLLVAALIAPCCVLLPAPVGAEAPGPWVADLGDGTYQNPVLYADYSDPDVVRVGDDFYMTASSFGAVPGLPILHSRDLVNWRLIGHAVQRLSPRFDTVQHGNGIWAPSIRRHDGKFWIFVGDPDLGILVTTADDPAGPWSELRVVQEGKGLIDPCPLWDEDGRAYLVHAYANSRSGRKSILVVREMAPDGSRLIGDERLVVDGRADQPTIEGPKFYKRNGWYYLFAPAGGVKPGWQVAARARSPFGPYEVRRVLEQGSTPINGPHQGGWVELENGEGWFLHFQDQEAYGRVVHLNPMRWQDDWPVMGEDYDGNGVGEPVARHAKPSLPPCPVQTPQASDTFDGPLGLGWQWQANPRDGWADLTARPGWLRLACAAEPETSLRDAPNALLQKFPAPRFLAETRIDPSGLAPGARAGLVVLGDAYAGLMVARGSEGLELQRIGADPNQPETTLATARPPAGDIWLRLATREGPVCAFSYSSDGERFEPLGEAFHATPGRWIGAKLGLVAVGPKEGGAAGHADFDALRVAPLQ